MRSTWSAALIGAVLVSCVGNAPNSGVGARKGADGRFQGYLYDADTGEALSDVVVSTIELGQKVSATTKDGYFTIDGLTASATYRLEASKEGYVTRIFTNSIAQVPTDAYDAVPVTNIGTQFMAKPSGSI